MRRCVDKIKPQQIIHLGDFFDDGKVLAEENPHITVHQVPGNCDRFRCETGLPEVLCYDIAGLRVFMTHGHRHCVKTGTDTLLVAARKWDAKLVLYGHTHQAACYRTVAGVWVLNPGSCGSYGGSVGLVEIADNEITSCRILRQEELEEQYGFI